MKKIITTLMIVALALSIAPIAYAKGGGGGRGGGGSRSISRPAPSPKPSVTPTPRPINTPSPRPTVAPTPRPPAQPPKPKITASPSKTTQQVGPRSGAKSITTTKSGKKVTGKGNVIDNTYQPRFRGGATYPAGSQVYYADRGFLDYLPWIFLFTQSSHREVVVYPATGSSTAPVAAPVETKEEGVDTMYVINMIITILLSIGLIGAIVYFINKKTTPQYV